MDFKKGTLKYLHQCAVAAAIALPLVFSAVAMAQESESSPSVALPPAQDSSTLSVGDLSFKEPLALLGLGTLPLLWWLLKVTPPLAKEYDYPPVDLIRDLVKTEEPPAKTPPWKMILCMTAASALILAAAQPVYNPEVPLEGSNPLLLLVDNGWRAGTDWDKRKEEMLRLVSRAGDENRRIAFLETAPPEDGSSVKTSGFLTAAEARKLVMGMKPQPWPVDRSAAAKAAESIDESVSTVWLSDGMDSEGTLDLLEGLKSKGAVKILANDHEELPLLLLPPAPEGDDLVVTVHRPAAGMTRAVTLLAKADDGRVVDRRQAVFDKDETEANAIFLFPDEIRNRITQLSIEGQESAGAVVLLDEKWRHRPVGLVSIQAPDAGHPLLDETHYVRQALRPYVDFHSGAVKDLLDQKIAVLVLTDSALLEKEDGNRLDNWIRKGGTVLRFAGAHLAHGEKRDDLFPVTLRPGDRKTESGLMSWGNAAKLAPFEVGSPFHGLDLPDDIEIRQQVLAEPDGLLEERTWAKLTDGTPLVTAERRGEGWLVLVHTSSDPAWSNLALSGLFVDILRTVVAHSQGVIGGRDKNAALTPWKTLDGKGHLGTAPASVEPLAFHAKISPQNPPGFYGDDSVRKAHNLADAVTVFKPLPPLPDGVERQPFTKSRENDLTGELLLGMSALLIMDLLLVLGQRGLLPGVGRGQKPSVSKPDYAYTRKL